MIFRQIIFALTIVSAMWEGIEGTNTIGVNIGDFVTNSCVVDASSSTPRATCQFDKDDNQANWKYTVNIRDGKCSSATAQPVTVVEPQGGIPASGADPFDISWDVQVAVAEKNDGGVTKKFCFEVGVYELNDPTLLLKTGLWDLEVSLSYSSEGTFVSSPSVDTPSAFNMGDISGERGLNLEINNPGSPVTTGSTASLGVVCKDSDVIIGITEIHSEDPDDDTDQYIYLAQGSDTPSMSSVSCTAPDRCTIAVWIFPMFSDYSSGNVAIHFTVEGTFTRRRLMSDTQEEVTVTDEVVATLSIDGGGDTFDSDVHSPRESSATKITSAAISVVSGGMFVMI